MKNGPQLRALIATTSLSVFLRLHSIPAPAHLTRSASSAIRSLIAEKSFHGADALWLDAASSSA